MALNFDIITVTPFRQNCSLLWDDATKDAVLVDVGGDVPFVRAAVAKHGVNVRELWLTHGHLDHAGGVVEYVSQHEVPVIGPHIEDEYLLQSLPQTTAQYGFPVSPAFTPARWLEEGDTLTVGRYAFQVLHAPGHTPGHVVFYCAEADLLVGGDVLFYESIGRTDFPRGSHEDLIHNIRTKLLVLPERTRVIAGHGMMTTIAHEKQHNPFL